MDDFSLYLCFHCDTIKCAEDLIKTMQECFSVIDVEDPENDVLFTAYIYSNRDKKFIEQCNVTLENINA